MAMLLKAAKELEQVEPILKQVESAKQEFIETYIKPVLEKRNWVFEIYEHEEIKDYRWHYSLSDRNNPDKLLRLVIDLTADPIVSILPYVGSRHVCKKPYRGYPSDDRLPSDDYLVWRLGLRNPSKSLEKRIDLYERKIYPEVKEWKRHSTF